MSLWCPIILNNGVVAESMSLKREDAARKRSTTRTCKETEEESTEHP